MGVLGTLGGIVGTAIGGPTGGTIGAALGGALEGGGSQVQSGVGIAGPIHPAVPTDAGTLVATSGAQSCPDGSFNVFGKCVDLTPGGDVSGGGMVLSTGEAVMGRYGAALVPMRRSTSVARCLPGMVLGSDGLCYNKRDIRNTERKWPKARKPLLTGGELNAINKAARAARRVKTTQKKLQRLGLLKKPTMRGRGGSRGVITKSEAARALRS